MIARTMPTCKGNPVVKRGLSSRKCHEFAFSMENVNFVWFAPKMAQWQEPEICALYKSCDLEKEGRYPERPGKTFKISDGIINILSHNILHLMLVTF